MCTVRARFFSFHTDMSIRGAKPYERVQGLYPGRGIKHASYTGLIVRNYRGTRHISKPMITIRQSKAASKLTLVCLDATLKTPRSLYTISSEDPMTDSRSFFADALFGAISWPVSRFRLAEGLLLEQQMFLPHDESAVAISFQSCGAPATHCNTAPNFSTNESNALAGVETIASIFPSHIL